MFGQWTKTVGAEQELNSCIQYDGLHKDPGFSSEQQCNAGWIKWKRNPPAACHMGGIWECQIRSARGILASLLQTHSLSLDGESLQTLMAEMEAVSYQFKTTDCGDNK